jgi:hypothetical protein
LERSKSDPDDNGFYELMKEGKIKLPGRDNNT